MLNLYENLQSNAYPGRGIVIGRVGDRIRIAYFIMGRSENSRNRVFVADGDGIRTQAFDPAKLADPSLIIYAPVRVIDGKTIVTNGDQTDTVYGYIKSEKTFEEALRTREFEPDAPNYTPRISGMVDGFDYKLSILKSAEGSSEAVRRYFFEYPNPRSGEGHFIHTYDCDGDPIPSFNGEPKLVALEEDFGAFTDRLWSSLNQDNKVSLFTREINPKTGETQTRIINKNA